MRREELKDEVVHAAWHLMDDSGETDDPGLFVHDGVRHERLHAALDALEASGWRAHPDE